MNWLRKRRTRFAVTALVVNRRSTEKSSPGHDGAAANASREQADRMNRRRLLEFIAAGGLAGRVTLLRAQPAAAMPRIGVLSFGTAPSGADPDPSAGFRRGLRELGYAEGRNLVVEYRYADGRPDRLAALAAELVQLKVRVILAGGPAPLQAARNATSTIAIVAMAGQDPVEEGWAQSLARPGGNVTGLTVTFPELGPKQLELLQQAVPGLARVAVLLAPAELTKGHQILEAGARALGLQLQMLEVSAPDDFEAAFKRATHGRAQGLYAIDTNTIVTHRSRLAQMAVSARLPSVSGFALLAEAGFLMSYGADLDALGRRAATYVDKILKGARPGDLAIERPTEFELVINRKTAGAFGITLPKSLLLRADRVIQ